MIQLTRRGRLVALALLAVPALGAAGASAKPSHAVKVKPTRVTCASQVADQIAADGVPVVTSAESGTQYGTVRCSKLLGSGVVASSFTTNGSGDLSGTMRWFFNTGTVRGTFHLIQNDAADPTTGSFTAVSYTGTVAVLGGTGTDKGLKGAGTAVCTSKDSLHLNCTMKLKLTPKPV